MYNFLYFLKKPQNSLRTSHVPNIYHFAVQKCVRMKFFINRD